jgi:hypothetical protein
VALSPAIAHGLWVHAVDQVFRLKGRSHCLRNMFSGIQS